MSAVVNPLQGQAQADLAALMSRRISDASLRKQYRLDQLFRHATRLFAFLVLALLAGILIALFIGGLSSMRTFGFGFFFSAEWNPVTERFGALVAIVGTLTTSVIALLIGILFKGPPMGIGVLTAGIILAIMVIPFIASVMRDVFEIVPAVLKESAYALGSTTWEVVWHVVLPYTKVGVVGGIMLGLGRALGETMAVTFVIGNAHRLSASLMEPGNSIASALANEFTEAVGDLYLSALIELGLVLFFITFVVLALSKLLLLRLARREGRTT